MDKRSPAYVRAELAERVSARSSEDEVHGRAQRILDGDPNVFLEVLSGIEEVEIPRQHHMFIANMMLNACDALAQRIAVRPNIEDDPTNTDSDLSLRRARLGGQVKRDWWKRNDMDVAGYQIARWLLAFAEVPILVRADMTRKIPCFEERHPLSGYASDGATWRPTPRDIIFRTRSTVNALRARFDRAEGWPEEWLLNGNRPVELIEKFDAGEYFAFCTGPAGYGETADVILERIPNRTGAPLFVVPRLVSAGSRQGAFNQMIGLMAAKARLQFLSIIAAERGVFPDTYVAGEIVDNQINQGPEGTTQIEKDAKVYRLGYQSSFQFLQEIDRLTGEMRQQGQYPAQMDALTPSTLATGRGNTALLSANVDTGIRERQTILAMAYREMLEQGVKVSKRFFGSAPIPIAVTSRGAKHVVTYRPSEMIEGVTNVEYGLLAAADVGNATVILGQMKGLGMSKRDVFEMHPYVADPEGALLRSELEELDLGLKASVQQDIANGVLDARAVIEMGKAMKRGRSLGEAYEEALEKMAERSQGGELAPMTPPMLGAPAPNEAPPTPDQILQTAFQGRI